MRYLLLVGVFLTGCGIFSTEDRPKLLLETAYLRTRYMNDHDETIRQTAYAVLLCRAAHLDAPLPLRQKCYLLDKLKADWERYDLIVRDALVYDATMRPTDWDRAADAAEKFKAGAKTLSGE